MENSKRNVFLGNKRGIVLEKQEKIIETNIITGVIKSEKVFSEKEVINPIKVEYPSRVSSNSQENIEKKNNSINILTPFQSSKIDNESSPAKPTENADSSPKEEKPIKQEHEPSERAQFTPKNKPLKSPSPKQNNKEINVDKSSEISLPITSIKEEKLTQQIPFSKKENPVQNNSSVLGFESQKFDNASVNKKTQKVKLFSSKKIKRKTPKEAKKKAVFLSSSAADKKDEKLNQNRPVDENLSASIFCDLDSLSKSNASVGAFKSNKQKEERYLPYGQNNLEQSSFSNSSWKAEPFYDQKFSDQGFKAPNFPENNSSNSNFKEGCNTQSPLDMNPQDPEDGGPGSKDGTPTTDLSCQLELIRKCNEIQKTSVHLLDFYLNCLKDTINKQCSFPIESQNAGAPQNYEEPKEGNNVFKTITVNNPDNNTQMS